MEVLLYNINGKDILDKVYLACRTCYNAGTPTDMYRDMQEKPVSEEKKLKLLKHVLDSGHHSVLEHQNLTFIISGVSRSLTHQLVRHRICSYSQKSQRYVQLEDGNFEFVYPPSILKDEEATRIFDECIEKISQSYAALTRLGIPAEDARGLLPNACCTDIVMSVNLRELIHICAERRCSCAQAEIRQLFNEIAKQVSKELPWMKNYLGPKCEQLGYCNESEKRTCGRKLLRKNMLHYIPDEDIITNEEFEEILAGEASEESRQRLIKLMKMKSAFN